MFKHPIVHVEFAVHNPAEAARFYSELFGWDISHDRSLDYAMFMSQGEVGGGLPKADGQIYKAGDVLVYVQTDDIDATLDQVVACGGQVVTPKMEIPNTGWMAFFIDPSGNRVGLYTPLAHEQASF